MTAPFRRKIFVLLLASFLAATWTMAGEPRHFAAPDRTGGFSWAPLDLLSRLWSALTGVWDDSGCTIDPNGTTGDSGCTLDPNGRCLGGS